MKLKDFLNLDTGHFVNYSCRHDPHDSTGTTCLVVENDSEQEKMTLVSVERSPQIIEVKFSSWDEVRVVNPQDVADDLRRNLTPIRELYAGLKIILENFSMWDSRYPEIVEGDKK